MDSLEEGIKTHAGSLTGNVLVLYSQKLGSSDLVFVIVVKDYDQQWRWYCNDLVVSNFNGSRATVSGVGHSEVVPCFLVDPEKALVESSRIAHRFAD